MDIVSKNKNNSHYYLTCAKFFFHANDYTCQTVCAFRIRIVFVRPNSAHGGEINMREQRPREIVKPSAREGRFLA